LGIAKNPAPEKIKFLTFEYTKITFSDIPALSNPYIHLPGIGENRVNLLLLTVPGWTGVINTPVAEHA